TPRDDPPPPRTPLPDSTNWPNVNPADPEAVRAALAASAQHINRQDERIKLVCRKLSELQAQQEEMMTSFSSQVERLSRRQNEPPEWSPSTVPGPAPSLPPLGAAVTAKPGNRSAPLLSQLNRFSGELGDCKTFLAQCEIHFELQPDAFPTDRARIAYIITHLKGRAEAWATAEWGRSSPVCQLSGRVVDNAIEFRILAAESSWNPPALFDAFLEGLSKPLNNQLAPLDLPPDLDSLIDLAIKIDKRLSDQERERSSTRSQRSLPLHQGRSPVGRTRLTPEERQRRMRGGLCLYCGEQGHCLASCPIRSPGRQRLLVSHTVIVTNPSRLQPMVTLTFSSVSLQHPC
uniref:CCHC-type domain-containing protein n=1 Tax=Seriola lalandi dorsalis TaxID=1841481 RepID=A0A3B4YG34_SERLL